jgi:hypothetical protein
MSATAWNLKKMMEKLKAEFLQLIFRLFFFAKFLSRNCVIGVVKD